MVLAHSFLSCTRTSAEVRLHFSHEPDARGQYTLAAGESARDLFILERQWEGSLVARNSAGEIIFELELAWEELEELEQIVIR